MSSCLICGEIAGDPSSDLLADLLGGPYQRRVVMESSRFAVLPSVGPLAVGHVLICPRDHVNRFASLPAEEFDELEALRAELERRLGTVAENCHFHYFEHGGDLAATRTPCTVDHAHIHLVPTPEDGTALPEIGNWRPVARLEAAMPQVGPEEYIWYQAPSRDAWIWEANLREAIPSQLMRRVIAELLGVAEAWNWREDPRVDVLAATLRALGAPEPILSGC